MNWFLTQLIFPIDSDTKVVYSYLQLLGVSVTKTGLSILLGEHPDSGTLLSVSDALTGLGVENVVASVSTEQLEQLEAPFTARMKSGDGLALAVVKQLDDDAVVYLPPAGGTTLGQQRWITTNKQTFFAVPFLAGLLIVPIFKKGKEGESHRRELALLKHTPQIFQALLRKQKAIQVQIGVVTVVVPLVTVDLVVAGKFSKIRTHVFLHWLP